MAHGTANIGKPGGIFDHGVIEAFGHAIGYASAGMGEEVLVICPGSAGTDGSWAKDVLAEEMRVVELNPPAWGGAPALLHKMDQRELAVILAAALEALGIERFHVHGASMGGVTAMWIALHFPERVRSLSVEGGMNFVSQEHLVSPENARVLADMVARGDPEGVGYPRAAPHPRKPWADDDYIRGQMRKRIPMMRMLTNAHEAEAEARLRTSKIPLLILLGDADELVKPNHLDRWCAIRPDAELMLIAGGAHDIQNTEPEQLVTALRHFHRMVP